jgi:antitoxin component YwqK of YwqJK toxin-antitoxin module
MLMRNIIQLPAFILGGLLFFFSCEQTPQAPQTVDKTEKYGTGAVSRRYQEIGGKKEGLMTDYYPDGRLKAERWFKNDQQTGRTVLYHPGGAIMEVQYYQDGKKEGGDTLFYENGRIQFAVEFHQEKKNGYLRKWSPEGDLVFEAKYVLDSLVEVKGKAVRPDSVEVK